MSIHIHDLKEILQSHIAKSVFIREKDIKIYNYEQCLHGGSMW